MALQICLALSISSHNSLNHSPMSSSPSTLISFSVQTKKKTVVELSSLRLSKRELCLSSFVLILNGLYPKLSKASLPEEMELQRYTDSNEGFTLLRPSSWIKVDKAGATVLFEEANKGTNNLGVVVNPVRVASLGEFGTPQFVADKLIQAEKRKESTIDTELIGASERSGHGGLKVYEFEYKVDSSRGGLKRIFSAAFVASKKLYLLNITHSDKPESPLDTHTRMMLEEVLHSFDAAPTT
ncbi:hypothetical protein CISIN_1g026386mg [Citrus sinensis]|uniref:PsbP C-terminal domain-containing protein n=2 Tax=Citrus sinensis TaxID=2711 RepID=A0A067EQP2_CITSI|nr:hypothetical protein CISIN_1g026386mg [Citrus sinensis]